MSSTINIIPPRYAKEVQEITEKFLDDLAEVNRITAVDEGDRRFLLKRCVTAYNQQLWGIKIEDQYRKEVAERKAS